MTLDGTNSYVVRAPGSGSVVIVDPGPGDADHIDALMASGSVKLILITHFHGDHTEASAELHERSGAPVRALDPAFCIGGDPLVDGEEITAAGVRITAVTTPGHTADSVCFVLPDDGPFGSILTGDTLLGRGTTVIARPDGNLGDYLDSLDRLRNLDAMTVRPGHGPAVPNLHEISSRYLQHRLQRLDEVRTARRVLGARANVGSITDTVYPDVDASVRCAAEDSVEAQLAYLDSAGDDVTL
nr:MBL fold metallo-hydrolase [Okibacterium sp. HSC-33S16]